MKKKIKGLQLIINTDPPPLYPLLELALQAIEGGVDSIQFRHKGTYTREHYSLALRLAELCHHFSLPFIVNDRFDIALALEADGVHLGQIDIPLWVARNFLGEKKIIGATVSTLLEAEKAQNEGADYLGFGHIFPTKTKVKIDPPLGVGLLKKACEMIQIPLLAIGGINETNIEKVCEVKPSGVAVSSAIGSSPNPLLQARKFKQILREYEKVAIC